MRQAYGRRFRKQQQCRPRGISTTKQGLLLTMLMMMQRRAKETEEKARVVTVGTVFILVRHQAARERSLVEALVTRR